MTLIPIVDGALGTAHKDLAKNLDDLGFRGIEKIPTTALLRSAKIFRRVLET